MGLTETKFKIGQKVKLLPSVVEVDVPEEEIGKTGEIIGQFGPFFLVHMDNPREGINYRDTWNVDVYQIELARVVGQQLLLWEDV